MKFIIHTFGCQANEHDSEIISGILFEEGHEETYSDTEADLIIFNTCCVREKAESKVFSLIGTYKDLCKKKPNLILGVCGCMVQQKDMLNLIKRRLPHVHLVFGTHNIYQLPGLLKKSLNKYDRVYSVIKDPRYIVEKLPSKNTHRHKALVHITFGCDNHCSYCIVPTVRGSEKSRQPADILFETRSLVYKGVQEIMLLGQNVNSYGKGLWPRTNFAELIRRINDIDGLKRVRYMTSHPRDFNLDTINAIKESEKICKHFHLPVQSGSDRILKLMNRGYDRAYYIDLINKIREYFPGCSITTDLIVGFPGETNNDFSATLDLVNTLRFDSAFTFIYSPRSGTPAAQLPEQIDDSTKKERLQELMKIQNSISLEKNLLLHDTILEVMVDGCSKNSSDILTGRTETNKTVLFRGSKDLEGSIVPVRITEPKTWILKGEI